MPNPDRLVKLGLFGVIAAGLALMWAGLRRALAGRGYAVLERKG